MYYDFSIVNKPYASPSIALRTVYVVQADSSYDVRKNGMPGRDLVALRTLAGEGRVILEGGQEMTVLPGTLVFFRHTHVRRYYCSSQAWHFWWFEFISAESLILPLNAVLHVDSVDQEEQDCRSCLSLLKKNEAGSLGLASATLSLLLGKWNQLLQSCIPSIPHGHLVNTAVEYMRANLHRSISIRELADQAGLCERRFRQVFLDVMGMQPKKYMEYLRMRLAEELLRNTPFSIGDIAERLGYSSLFHFSRAFRSYFHMPPSQYRRERLGNLS